MIPETDARARSSPLTSAALGLHALARAPALGLALALASHAHAAGESPVDARYEQALQQVLADVANPERSFEFAEAAVAAGDLRGAAAALERILLIDPRLANIRLGLGEIYLRMNEPVLAQYHISEALRAPNMPQSVRLRAQRLLADAGRAGARNTFRLETSLGYRHDSNANAGPSSSTVYALDPFTFQSVLVPLGSGGETSDSALTAAAVLSHSFAFADTRGSSWDSDLSVYGIWYSDLGELSQLSVRLESGPTWVVAGSASAPVSIRPFGLLGTARLQNADYYRYGGGGLAFDGFWSAATVTQLRVSYENRTFQDTPARFLSDRSGSYLTSQLQQIWQLGKLQLMLGLIHVTADTRADYQSFKEFGGQASARWFDVFGGAQRPWNVYASVAYAHSDYDAADAFINPAIVRTDRRLDVASGLEVAITGSISVALDLTYSSNDSNLPNFEHDNLSAGVRATYRF